MILQKQLTEVQINWIIIVQKKEKNDTNIDFIFQLSNFVCLGLLYVSFITIQRSSPRRDF